MRRTRKNSEPGAGEIRHACRSIVKSNVTISLLLLFLLLIFGDLYGGIVFVRDKDAATWQDSEITLLNDTLALLPDEYRSLPTISIKKGNHKTDIKKKIIYLPSTLRGQQEVKQHFVQELTRFLDRDKKISESRQWRKISRWQGWDILGNRCENTNIKGFATPGGRKSPVEDFVTSAAMFFVPPEYKDSMEYLKCRLPSKYAFFKNLFAGRPDPQGCIQCTHTYKDWIDPDNVEQIELLIASPSFASLASIAGHILLLVRQKDDISGHSTTVGFVARPVDKKGKRDRGLTYMIRGIFGYYKSLLQIETLADVLQRYTLREDRNIYRLKLDLCRQQVRALICRLWEIDRTFTYKYYFFNRNCTTMFANLIDYVLPEGQAFNERDRIDLPLNVGSELYLKGFAEFVYPEYWGISKQAKYAITQNKKFKAQLTAYFQHCFPGETAVCMGRHLRDTFSPEESTRMAAYHKVLSLYSALADTLYIAARRSGKAAHPGLSYDSGSPGRHHEIPAGGPNIPGSDEEGVAKEFYTQGKLLLKYLMNARTVEKYRKILHEKKTQRNPTGKGILNDETKVLPLVDIILKLRHLLGQHYSREALPVYDEIEQELTDHTRRSRAQRTFDCGYSPIFVSPRLIFSGDNFRLGNSFRISTLSQEMGDNSVFSLGCDTYIEFFNFDLSFYKAYDRKSGVGIGETTAWDTGFKFLEYEKVMVGEKAGYRGRFNPGFGISLFNTTHTAWKNVKRDTSFIDLRFLLNVFEIDDFTHFCTAAFTCGYSSLIDNRGRRRRFLDVGFRLKGKFHLTGSRRNALRLMIALKPRLTFSSSYMSEFRATAEIDWSQGALSSSLFTTGFSYEADTFRFAEPGWTHFSDQRWSFYTVLRFKGKLLPPWMNPKKILNEMF